MATTSTRRFARLTTTLLRGGAACRGLVVAASAGLVSVGCVTVQPQQRAVLADPVMQFTANSKREAALQHALDNREGSSGGGAVEGGGCGCN